MSSNLIYIFLILLIFTSSSCNKSSLSGTTYSKRNEEINYDQLHVNINYATHEYYQSNTEAKSYFLNNWNINTREIFLEDFDFPNSEEGELWNTGFRGFKDATIMRFSNDDSIKHSSNDLAVLYIQNNSRYNFFGRQDLWPRSLGFEDGLAADAVKFDELVRANKMILDYFYKHTVLLDLSGSILLRDYHNKLGSFKNLQFLVLPFWGSVMQSDLLILPESLKEIIIYNTEICNSVIEKLSKLPNLERIAFVNCWSSSFLSINHKRDEVNYGRSSQLFDPLSNKIKRIDFVECSEGLLRAASAVDWQILNSVVIIKSTSYLGFTTKITSDPSSFKELKIIWYFNILPSEIFDVAQNSVKNKTINLDHNGNTREIVFKYNFHD